MKTLIASLLLCGACILAGCASDGPPPVAPPNPLDSASNSPDASLTPLEEPDLPGSATAYDDSEFDPPAYNTPSYASPSYDPPATGFGSPDTPVTGHGSPDAPPADYSAPAPEDAPGGGCGAGGSA